MDFIVMVTGLTALYMIKQKVDNKEEKEVIKVIIQKYTECECDKLERQTCSVCNGTGQRLTSMTLSEFKDSL